MTAPYRIAFLLYPDLTQLDLTGPAQVLSRMPGATVDFLWKSRDPVMSDCGLALLPTATLADGGQYQMLCVPGGYGCTAMMEDTEVLGWLRAQATGDELVTSVCTGSLILAAAGLLEGYRAGCHWAWGEYLPLFGAEYVAERVVFDRNRITAGGVTSGIDFAFATIAALRGEDAADTVRLMLEYDPPATRGGTPATARPEITQALRALLAKHMAPRIAAIERIARG